MKELSYPDKVDALIQHFWKNGYLTVSRKFGTYLPEPKVLGKYEIDAFGKYKKSDYAIGITLTAEEIKFPEIVGKLEYLATRHTKFKNKDIKLFVAVPSQLVYNTKLLLFGLSDKARKNIEVVPLLGNLN